MNIQKIILPLVVTFVLTACLKDHETEYERQVKLSDEAITAYLQENELDAERSPSGVYFKAVHSNPSGTKVAQNNIVSVVYRMNLLSGATIEVYNDTLNPVKFSHSANALVPVGLNQEIDRMRVGETYRFYIPSYLAFDNYGHENLFGAYSNFILEVTVVGLQTEDQQYEEEMESIEDYLTAHDITTVEKYANGLNYIPTLAGSGNKPSALGQVKVHFTRKYLDGTVIKTTVGKQPLTVQLGQNNLVKGFEEGVKLMNKGGKAILIMPSKMAFGKSIQVLPQKVREDWVEDELLNPETMPYTPVIYEVELLEAS